MSIYNELNLIFRRFDGEVQQLTLVHLVDDVKQDADTDLAVFDHIMQVSYKLCAKKSVTYQVMDTYGEIIASNMLKDWYQWQCLYAGIVPRMFSSHARFAN